MHIIPCEGAKAQVCRDEFNYADLSLSECWGLASAPVQSYKEPYVPSVTSTPSYVLIPTSYVPMAYFTYYHNVEQN